MARSKHLNGIQLWTLTRVGDVMIPGDGDMPPFSQSGSLENVDRMLDDMYDSDRLGVKFLLYFCAPMPKPLIHLFLLATEQQHRVPGPLATPLRLINIGLKGVAMTLYYSDFTEDARIHGTMNWDSQIVEREEAPQQSLAPDTVEAKVVGASR